MTTMRSIALVFSQNVAQQPASGCAAYCLQRIAMRQHRSGGTAQPRAEQGVVGLAALIPRAPGQRHSDQRNDRDATDIKFLLHARAPVYTHGMSVGVAEDARKRILAF